jgi:hypothetical protein
MCGPGKRWSPGIQSTGSWLPRAWFDSLQATNHDRSVWAGFGVFFTGSMKTPENTSKHFWAVWWAGFGLFRPDKTRQNPSGWGGSKSRPLPRVFVGLLATRGRCRRQGRKTTSALPLQDHAAADAPSDATPTSPSQVPTFSSRPHRPNLGPASIPRRSAAPRARWKGVL